MAYPCAETFCKALSGNQTSDHRTAYPGYHVPTGKGRYSSDPRGFWYRKDHDPASDRKMVWCGCYYLHRLWWAWKWNDSGSGRIFRADRSKERKSPDGQNYIDRKYLQHACCSPWSKSVCRCNTGRVLQGYGISCSDHGRLYLPLGRGFAWAFRPSGRDAGRGRLPGLSGIPSVFFLRESRHDAQFKWYRRFCYHYRCGFPSGRWFLWACYPEYQTFCTLLLGTG